MRQKQSGAIRTVQLSKYPGLAAPSHDMWQAATGAKPQWIHSCTVLGPHHFCRIDVLSNI